MNQSPTFSSTSPTSKQKQMDFPEAIRQITIGKKVTKLEWDDKKIYGFLNGNILSLHKEGKNYQWVISDGDLVGKDWVVID